MGEAGPQRTHLAVMMACLDADSYELALAWAAVWQTNTCCLVVDHVELKWGGGRMRT